MRPRTRIRARVRARRGSDAVDIEGVAAVVQRLAVLLAAGVAPLNAWRYLDDSAPVVGEVSRLASEGVPVPSAILRASRAGPARPAEAWRAVAASWLVASESGAPLAGCLRDIADTLRQLGQLHRDVDAALAGPISTARFVAAMPVVGLLFGAVLGFDTFGVLFTTPPGLVCFVLGAILTIVSQRWTARLVRRARPDETSPGLQRELVAIALAGGGAISSALDTVAAATARLGMADESERRSIDRVLALSRRAGVPAAELLRSEADQARRESRSLAQARAARLGTTLMIPLGLCVLPAFMLLGVAPLLLAVLTSTLSGL
jgi:tight adherence protein B